MNRARSAALAAAALIARDPGSLLSWYRELIRLRSANAPLQLGSYATATSSSPNVLAEVRTAGTVTDIVLTNLADAPSGGVTISLRDGQLCGTPAASLVLGTGPVVAPIVTKAGGFDGYVPVGSIPPFGTVIVALAGS